MRAPEWLVVVGAGVFIVVLAVAAIFDASIRWLHFVQAWMYLATIVLTVRGSKLGYFIGVSAAGLWDYINVFVTNFLANGIQHLASWISTGILSRPDQLIAIPAWISNLLVVIGCLWAYARHTPHTRPRRADIGVFLVTFALTTAFFAADMALFQPRYLALFPRTLHPHISSWKR
jgi:hypothetical protein